MLKPPCLPTVETKAAHEDVFVMETQEVPSGNNLKGHDIVVKVDSPLNNGTERIHQKFSRYNEPFHGFMVLVCFTS